MKLNYFDLGPYKDGKEIDLFIKICEENNYSYKIYAIEAHPEYCQCLKKKYVKNNNVFIVNKAICDEEKKIKLYLNYSFNGEGNSIFSSKNNVTDDYIWVDGSRFSVLLEEITPNYRNENNILRYNIEGAEWCLINDLNENKLFKYFKIVLGVKPDIPKVLEIKHNLNNYLNILKRNNVLVGRFSGNSSNLNIDLSKLIKSKFS